MRSSTNASTSKQSSLPRKTTAWPASPSTPPFAGAERVLGHGCALEEAIEERSAKHYRKIEYLNIIGAVSPMIGLFGTVVGMILLFAAIHASDTFPQAQSWPTRCPSPWWRRSGIGRRHTLAEHLRRVPQPHRGDDCGVRASPRTEC